MAISEQPPRTQPEQKQTPDATVIAYHVAAVEDNLQQDRQAIDNPYEVCLNQYPRRCLSDGTTFNRNKEGREPMTNYHLTPPQTLPYLAVREAREKRKQVLAAVRKRRKCIYHHFREHMREQHKHHGFDRTNEPHDE